MQILSHIYAFCLHIYMFYQKLCQTITFVSGCDKLAVILHRNSLKPKGKKTENRKDYGTE